MLFNEISRNTDQIVGISLELVLVSNHFKNKAFFIIKLTNIVMLIFVV